MNEQRTPCEHEPVSTLGDAVTASTIFPGEVAFAYFDFDSWICLKCQQPLKATWHVTQANTTGGSNEGA